MMDLGTFILVVGGVVALATIFCAHQLMGAMAKAGNKGELELPFDKGYALMMGYYMGRIAALLLIPAGIICTIIGAIIG